MINETLDQWFIENLVCPLDKSKLTHQDKSKFSRFLYKLPIYYLI